MDERSENKILIENKPYTIRINAAVFQGKRITVKGYVPVLNDIEYAKRTEEIKSDLYDVFVKYEA